MSPYELEANQIVNCGREVGKGLWRAVNIDKVRDPLETFSKFIEIIADGFETCQERKLFTLAARDAIPGWHLSKETRSLFIQEFEDYYDEFVKERENAKSRQD